MLSGMVICNFIQKLDYFVVNVDSTYSADEPWRNNSNSDWSKYQSDSVKEVRDEI